MRPRLLYGDISCAARAALGVDRQKRVRFVASLLVQAETADRYVQKYRRAHPQFGNGSLMGAARKSKLVDEPSYSNLEYCKAVMLVLQAIVDRYDTQA